LFEEVAAGDVSLPMIDDSGTNEWKNKIVRLLSKFGLLTFLKELSVKELEEGSMDGET
jgi:hypothetical protein